MALVSLEAAKRHLRVTGDDEDDDITAKLEQASAIVRRILTDDSVTGWTEDTDPADDTEYAVVMAAILDTLGNLYGDRGDNEKVMEDGPLTLRWRNTLIACGLVDPTLG